VVHNHVTRVRGTQSLNSEEIAISINSSLSELVWRGWGDGQKTRHDQEYEEHGPRKQRPTGKARTRTPQPRPIGSCLLANARTCVSVGKDSCEPCVEEPPRDGKGGDRPRIFFKIEELQMHLQPQLLFSPWTNGLQMHVQPQLFCLWKQGLQVHLETRTPRFLRSGQPHTANERLEGRPKGFRLSVETGRVSRRTACHMTCESTPPRNCGTGHGVSHSSRFARTKQGERG